MAMASRAGNRPAVVPAPPQGVTHSLIYAESLAPDHFASEIVPDILQHDTLLFYSAGRERLRSGKVSALGFCSDGAGPPGIAFKRNDRRFALKT